MSFSLFGQIVGVRKYVNGDIEVDFYHEDEIAEYRYFSDENQTNAFPKELIETLASTLATNVCVEIYFDDQNNPTYVELEECEDDLDKDEDFDEGDLSDQYS